jgi:hypothetical protein
VCTVSWIQQPGGYHLLANRDEKRTRGTAFAPRVQKEFSVRYVAPIDPESGGTWIAVNEFGVTFCLLNAQADFQIAPQRSRGLVIRELVWVRCVDDGAFLLGQLDLTGFAPFTLVLLEPGRPATVANWSGSRVTIAGDAEPQMPLTSSSYDAAGVRRFRLQEFARHAGPAARIDPAVLYEFHASHGTSPNAYSPCMHREDAETVSFSWVVVTPEEARFLYSPSAPCRCSPSEQKLLARAA